MTGPCPECGHDPSSDELERRCEQLMEENRRLRGERHVHGWSEIECPCCGDVAAEGYWFLDGTALMCGCKGSIACDSETEPGAVVDDCDCQEERAAIDRLVAGHLEVLSRQWWVGTLDSGENLSFCPFCEAFEDEPHLMDRGRDCAWVISARACGIAD